jgi:hypoxanthine phosphoribosyltransferase
MALDAVALLNLASTVLAGSTAILVALGVRNLRKSDSERIVSNGSPAVSDALRSALKGQLRLSSRPTPHLPILTPRRLVDDDRLTQAAADIGVADLEILLRALMKATSRTPHLVGVNKGGALVANFLAHRLALHEKFLIKCDFRADLNKVYCEERPELHDVVLIDDVVRTGHTISRVKNYFSEKHPRSNVFSVCLVYVQNTQQSQTTSVKIDYHAWFATSRHIMLPWSHRPDHESKTLFDDKEINQILGEKIDEIPELAAKV